MWHLSTRFQGVLTDPAPSALELVAALHPTPAVGGTPRDAALDAISELEAMAGRGELADMKTLAGLRLLLTAAAS